MAESKHDRSEAPTHRKLEDAHKKGQIPRSRDLGSAAAMLACAGALAFGGPAASAWLMGLARANLSGVAAVDLGDARLLGPLARELGEGFLLCLMPFALLAVLASMAAGFLQSGFVVSSEPLKPNLDRFNPSNGLKRLVPGKQTLQGIAKNVTATVSLLWVAYRTLQPGLPEIFDLCEQDSRSPLALPRLLLGLGGTLLLRLALVFAALGILDYVLARRKYFEDLKMTKAEVRQEMKDVEGNPQVKGRRRQIARRYSLGRMLADVPKSDAIVMNPTHYAIALRYRKDVAPAPIVLAKGQDGLAQKIKALARRHGIMMVENRALARALYAKGKVGKPVPVELYRAVAEVLAYVYRLNGQARKLGP